MSIVKERKTVFLAKTLDNTGTFEHNLNIPFGPDELRIVQIVYAPDAYTTDTTNTLSMEGVGPLCLFDNGTSVANANIRINVHGQSFQGMHRFTITKPDRSLVTDMNGTSLGIVFEAIKY